MEAERVSFDDRLAGLEQEVARARREADVQIAEVEALKAQVRLTAHPRSDAFKLSRDGCHPSTKHATQ